MNKATKPASEPSKKNASQKALADQAEALTDQQLEAAVGGISDIVVNKYMDKPSTNNG